jgi:endonuclease III-like iron-sulfur protein
MPAAAPSHENRGRNPFTVNRSMSRCPTQGARSRQPSGLAFSELRDSCALCSNSSRSRKHSFSRPAFPVDTHVHRVSSRLGLIPPKATADAAHDLIEALIPPQLYVPFHVSLIRHGREICHARSPRCEVCPLKDIGDYCHALSVPAAASPQSVASSTARTRRPARPAMR